MEKRTHPNEYMRLISERLCAIDGRVAAESLTIIPSARLPPRDRTFFNGSSERGAIET